MAKEKYTDKQVLAEAKYLVRYGRSTYQMAAHFGIPPKHCLVAHVCKTQEDRPRSSESSTKRNVETLEWGRPLRKKKGGSVRPLLFLE